MRINSFVAGAGIAILALTIGFGACFIVLSDFRSEQPRNHYRLVAQGEKLRVWVVNEQTGEVQFCTIQSGDDEYGCETLQNPPAPVASPTPVKSK